MAEPRHGGFAGLQRRFDDRFDGDARVANRAIAFPRYWPLWTRMRAAEVFKRSSPKTELIRRAPKPKRYAFAI
jgi:hypothetical protein